MTGLDEFFVDVYGAVKFTEAEKMVSAARRLY